MAINIEAQPGGAEAVKAFIETQLQHVVTVSSKSGAQYSDLKRYVTNCPTSAHPNGDRHPSLEFYEVGKGSNNHKVHFVCRSGGCREDEILLAWGLPKELLYTNPSSIPGWEQDIKSTRFKTALTLQQFAEAKKLKVDDLISMGVHEDIVQFVYQSNVMRFKGVVFDYFTPDGEPYGRNKLRCRLKRDDGKDFEKWTPGQVSTNLFYGLQGLPLARAKRYVVLVEGESDTLTGQLHAFPMFGISGANNVKSAFSVTLQMCPDLFHGIEIVYVMQEQTDDAGNNFPYLVQAALRKAGFAGKVLRIPLQDLKGAKDPSELYINLQGDDLAFKEEFQYCLNHAEPVPTNTLIDELSIDAAIESGDMGRLSLAVPELIKLSAVEYMAKDAMIQECFSPRNYATYRRAFKEEQEKLSSRNIAVDVQNAQTQSRKSYACTDLGNAERFASRYRGTVVWCETWNCWLIYNGICWERDTTRKIDTYAAQVVRSIYAEATFAESRELREQIADHAVKSESRKLMVAMLEGAKSMLPTSPKAFYSEIHTLNFANGILDLRTGELREHTPTYMETRCLSRKYVPASKDNIPVWRNFIKTIFGDNQELINYIQRCLGMSLSGDTREKAWFLPYGRGNNGKSTCIEALRELLEDYGLAAKIETFLVTNDSKNYERSDFYGKRMVTASEPQKGARLNESFIKKLTAGGMEKLPVERKYENQFDFTPECTVWISANDKPVVKDTSDGMWNRVRYIPFEVTIPDDQIDGELPAKLLAEGEGILAWAVEGCMKWYAERKLTTPELVKAATDTYRKEQDIITLFIEQECVLEPTAKIGTTDLNRRFDFWCRQNSPTDEKNYALLKGELNKRNLRSTKSTGGKYVYKGIGLQSNETGEQASAGCPSEKGELGEPGGPVYPKLSNTHAYRENLGEISSPGSPSSPLSSNPQSNGVSGHSSVEGLPKNSGGSGGSGPVYPKLSNTHAYRENLGEINPLPPLPPLLSLDFNKLPNGTSTTNQGSEENEHLLLED